MVRNSSRVYVVDDDPHVSRSMELVMQSVQLPVSLFDTAESFLKDYDPDADLDAARCLLLDVRLPGMSGLDLQRELANRRIVIPIIILSGNADIPMAVGAVKAGAMDFLEKPLHRRLLLERVHEALERDEIERPLALRRLNAERALDDLTQKEREVLNHMLHGKSNKQIAFALDITIQTASKHSSRVLGKIGVSCAVDLLRLLGERPSTG